MVGDMPGSLLGMWSDLAMKLKSGAITPDQLAMFLKKQNPFPVRELAPVLEVEGQVSKDEKLVAEWTRFYREFFKLETDFSDIVLPSKQDDFNWLIVVLKDMTINRAIQACRKHFKVWTSTDDLDGAVTQNDRSPKNDAYAIWVRDRVEADEKNKNLSANDLKSQRIAGISLLERILLEAWHFWKFKKHLDIQKITLCSGSRGSVGIVPGAYWYDDELNVRWGPPAFQGGCLRGRSVVS